ncbi:MAG TPA: 50S ribosomal protein L28 [Patescibacteria group bacterium]|jgi:large subunit ribosomal protein L28|nr:50S ribosomal protein L28 [Patescibacteria group bacterium]
MAAICFNCGKGVMYGHNVSHAKNRTRKIFKPNLHSARIIVGGTAKKVRLCTKCIRKFKEATVNVKSVDIVPEAAPVVAV